MAHREVPERAERALAVRVTDNSNIYISAILFGGNPLALLKAAQVRRVRLAALIVGLSGGPAAWSVAWMASVILAQEACYPGATPLATPAFGHVHVILILLNGFACAITVASGIVAYRSWLATRAEQPGQAQTLLEIGEGRARFMAMAGMLTSAGFLVGIFFGVPAIIFGPLC